MNKVIVLDSGFFTHKAIHAYGGALKRKNEGGCQTVMGSAYNYFNMVCATLKKIGIDRDDLIIVAKDGRSSWRKAFLQAYKGNRKALREKVQLFDWSEEYDKVSALEYQLHEATNWQFIGFNYFYNFADLVLTDEGRELGIHNYDIEYDREFSIESDDIQAVCCKRFRDKEVILVTIDEDLDQLCYFDNVKIFNPNLKNHTKSTKGFYKIVENPLEVLNKKVRLGDVSDNIRKDNSTPEIRKVVIDLINIPKFVEDPILEVLNDLPEKQNHLDKMPMGKLGEKFETIYDEYPNVVTMEKSIEAHQFRVERKKKMAKASYERRKAKLKKQKEESLR